MGWGVGKEGGGSLISTVDGEGKCVEFGSG